MTARRLNCGFVPLVDSAPLILARELGFARDEGIELNLLRQPSWSALRDLLALGDLDAAHMLSPMPLAMRLGLSGARTLVDAPMVLSVNGTVLGVSIALAERLRNVGWSFDPKDPRGFADALAKLAAKEPFRVGVPFSFSMHRLLFEYLLADQVAAGRVQFDIVPTPPPLMAQAVAAGDVDIFCVGEPWGTVAVTSKVAELVVPGSAIWANSPEKVLGMRRDWIEANMDLAAAMVRATYRASEWLNKSENIPLAGEILAETEHLGLSDSVIDPALNRRLVFRSGRPPRKIPEFVKFFRGATTFPWRSLGAWIGSKLAQHYQLDTLQAQQEGAACFRPDLYRAFLDQAQVDMPGASSKIEGAMPHLTAVASTRGQLILGPDAFFDGKTHDFPEIN